jgi:hypothetical protein
MNKGCTSGPLNIKLDRMAGLGKVGTMVQHKHRLVTVRISHFDLRNKNFSKLLTDFCN